MELREKHLSNYMGEQIKAGFPDFIDGVLWDATLGRGKIGTVVIKASKKPSSNKNSYSPPVKPDKTQTKDKTSDKTPSFVAENRVPLDKETVLGNGSFTKTNLNPVKGAQVYKKGEYYYHRDTLHKGKGYHLEVYDKRGNHVGEADPLTGKLIPETRDPKKKIKV